MDKLRENLKRNGLVVNLLVRELPTGYLEVLDGNHRLEVLRELKVESAHAFNFGVLTDGAAQRIALEVNENTFEADPLKLGKLLKELQSDTTVDDLAKTLPWSPAELTNFIDMNSFDWSEKNYDPDDSSKQGEKDPNEDFDTVRIPASLSRLFGEQMRRARDGLREGLGREVREDEVVSPFEVILVTFAGIEMESIVADIAGAAETEEPSDQN
jgi:ParB-like chromosome segregation protein Spo0J